MIKENPGTAQAVTEGEELPACGLFGRFDPARPQIRDKIGMMRYGVSVIDPLDGHGVIECWCDSRDAAVCGLRARRPLARTRLAARSGGTGLCALGKSVAVGMEGCSFQLLGRRSGQFPFGCVGCLDHIIAIVR